MGLLKEGEGYRSVVVSAEARELWETVRMGYSGFCIAEARD